MVNRPAVLKGRACSKAVGLQQVAGPESAAGSVGVAEE